MSKQPKITSAYLSKTPRGVLMPFVWYGRPRPEAPDILLARLPVWMQPAQSGGSDVNHAFTLAYAENAQERADAEAAMDKPLEVTGPNVNVTIPPMGMASREPHGEHWLFAYDRYGAGWPILIVTMLPHNMPGEGLGRDRYAIDCFMSETAAQKHLNAIVADVLTFPEAMVYIQDPSR